MKLKVRTRLYIYTPAHLQSECGRPDQQTGLSESLTRFRARKAREIVNKLTASNSMSVECVLAHQEKDVENDKGDHSDLAAHVDAWSRHD